MKSEAFLKEHLEDYFDDGLILTPHIPEKKLVTASHKIANGISPEYIIGIVDTTLFRSAKEGLVFTGDSVYLHEGALGLDTTQKISYDQISSATFSVNKQIDDNGTEQTSKVLTIECKGLEDPLVYESNSFPLKSISTLLNDMKERVDEVDSTNQQLVLTDLPSEVILSYLELIVNYLKHDGIIDKDEYANLAGLVGTLSIQDDIKESLMRYRLESNYFKPNNDLINLLLAKVPDGSQPTVFQSLINDLLLMMSPNDKENWKNIPEFTTIQTALSVSDDQVNFYLRKQELDHKIIADRLSDTEASKLMTNIMSFGTGAGASIAAFGVTGLAIGAFGELGLGTLAIATMSTGGLALAITGISAAGIVGYESVKHLTGRPIEKEATRGQLLQTKIEQQNSAMTLLINDINYISNRISALIDAQNIADYQIAQTTERLETLKQFISQLKSATDASNVAKNTQESSQHEIAVSSLPQSLEIEKVENLLNHSANNSKFSAVLEYCYHYGNSGRNKLDTALETQYLTAADQILENIGYYKVATIANAKNLGKKGLNFLNNIGK